MAAQAKLSADTKYRLLMQILLRMQDTLDLDQILNHLLDAIRPVIPYDAAGVFVLYEDLLPNTASHPAAMIAGVAWRGFLERPVAEDPMLSMGAGIIGQVIRSGRGMVIGDVREEPIYVEGRPQTMSEIAVPIFRNKRAIGALNLESDMPDAFSTEDLDVLTFFADAAAISIEKAVLHQQLLEKKRVEDQLHIARDVQVRLLPAEAPSVPGYDLAGTCLPTDLIGGDYFDYLSLDDGRLGLVIADVSGKGVPAALIMSAFRAILRAQMRAGRDPARSMTLVNRLLPDFTAQADFVTAFLGVLDPSTGWLAYTNCGHNPPLLLRADGVVKSLESGSLPLGLFDEVSYTTSAHRLAPGEWLVLYTDGVVDCLDARQEPFGVNRLAEVVRAGADLSAAAMVQSIAAATRALGGPLRHEDDYTVVALKRH